jgi:hypothetical protein
MARINHDHIYCGVNLNVVRSGESNRLYPRIGSEQMKSLLLAAALTVATGTASFADALYWVVGNRATGKCDIVSQNPVIYADGGGNFWFEDGPYRSVADAKLARSTISVCPEKDPFAD